MKWMLTALAAVVAAIGAWYGLVGSRYISEADVRGQYQNEANWLDEGKHAQICAVFDDAYVGRVASVTAEGHVLEQTDKKSSCAALATFFASLQKLNEKAGGGVVTNSTVLLKKVVISPDRQSALVMVRSQVKVGTEKTLMMTLTSEGTDTLIKRGGKVLRLSSEGMTTTQ